MQDCFRQHPDIYGSELEDDAPNQEEEATAPAPASTSETPAPPTPIPDPSSDDNPIIPIAATSAVSAPSSTPSVSETTIGNSDTERARAAKRQVEREHGEMRSESDELVPKAAHDATDVALAGAGAVGAGGGK